MRILMISNHLGVQSGVQRYVQNLLLNLDTTKYHIDLFVGQCPADQASTAPALEAHGVRLALDCNRVWVDEREVDLTETEYKILRLLMQNPQRIYSIQVIYETVWNEPYYYVSNGTVMVHIRNLRMKVEDDPQNPARICTVWGKGYRFAAGEEGRL